jgi:hypothetical protein
MDSDNTAAAAAATGGLIRESWKAVELLLQLHYMDSDHDCTEFAAARWIEHL